MSLTIATGPFGSNGGTWNVGVPERVWYVEDHPRRMRATQTLIDSRRAQLLHETFPTLCPDS